MLFQTSITVFSLEHKLTLFYFMFVTKQFQFWLPLNAQEMQREGEYNMT